MWNQDFALGRFLTRIGAITLDSEVLAPCPFFADRHSGRDPYKVVISRGEKRPLVWFCRVCKHSASTEIGDVWGCNTKATEQWMKEADAAEYRPLDCAAIRDRVLPPLGTLDAAYRWLVTNNPVTEHQPAVDWLERQGIPPDHLDRLEYGWFPGDVEWAESQIQQVDVYLAELDTKYTANSIPGLYLPTDLRGPGIAIPCRDWSGMIHGIKLRLGGERSKKFRMRHLSSGKENTGPKARLGLHFAGDFRERKPAVLLEGERKADVVTCHYPEFNAISIPGVNTLGLLAEWMRSLADRRVSRGRLVPPSQFILALDKDAQGRECQDRAARLIRDIYPLVDIDESGSRGVKGLDQLVLQAGWDESCQKVDDFIAAGGRVKWDQPLPESRTKARSEYLTLNEALADGPLSTARFDVLYPHLRDKLRIGIGSGSVQLRKYPVYGPAVASSTATEEDWERWTQKAKSVIMKSTKS